MCVKIQLTTFQNTSLNLYAHRCIKIQLTAFQSTLLNLYAHRCIKIQKSAFQSISLNFYAPMRIKKYLKFQKVLLKFRKWIFFLVVFFILTWNFFMSPGEHGSPRPQIHSTCKRCCGCG